MYPQSSNKMKFSNLSNMVEVYILICFTPGFIQMKPGSLLFYLGIIFNLKYLVIAWWYNCFHHKNDGKNSWIWQNFNSSPFSHPKSFRALPSFSWALEESSDKPLSLPSGLSLRLIDLLERNLCFVSYNLYQIVTSCLLLLGPCFGAMKIEADKTASSCYSDFLALLNHNNDKL